MLDMALRKYYYLDGFKKVTVPPRLMALDMASDPVSRLITGFLLTFDPKLTIFLLIAHLPCVEGVTKPPQKGGFSFLGCIHFV